MSDRFDTTISIGGTLTADLDEFASLIEDWEDDPGGMRWVDFDGSSNFIKDGERFEEFSVRNAEARVAEEKVSCASLSSKRASLLGKFQCFEADTNSA